jgi:hypothetical protein
LLCFVPTQPSSPAVAVGSVAAAATTGALVAMGHRLGSAALPFSAIGAALVRRTVTAQSGRLVFAGVVLHVTVVFLWSAVFVSLVRRARWRAVVAGFAVGAGELLISRAATSITGAGVASVLQFGDQLVLAMVYALALVAGMRFAFSLLRNA